MALNCEEKLSADIQKDCDNKPIGGIEVDVVLINLSDIDKATSTLAATNDLLITNLATNTGTSGYFVEGIKQSQGASFELVKKEDSFDVFKHTFSGVVLNPSVENKASLSSIASGERYVAIVEKKWKGEGQEDAFEVLGWDAGLEISEMTWNTKESDGIIKFVIASPDGNEEPRMTRNLLETNYATTKTAFDNKFATA
tara:strand:- start:16203 stop:16796 length:594 start_codon:yes stop_codon:yes gene_type:complete